MIIAFGWAEAGVIAALAGTTVTALALYVTIRGMRDQLWLLTFSEYTRRYAEVVRDLPSEPSARQLVRHPGIGDERGRILNSARAYLNLASEEFFLHRRGRIDDETWSIWRTGIEQTVRLPWLRGAWATRARVRVVPEFRALVNRCIAAAE